MSDGKHPGGRPREYPRDKIIPAFRSYITDTEIPIVAEFAVSQGVSKHLLYMWAESDTDEGAELFNLIKDCVTKKESALERKALAGEVNVTMSIFSLKQLGWSDKTESTLKGDKNNPVMIGDAAAKW